MFPLVVQQFSLIHLASEVLVFDLVPKNVSPAQDTYATNQTPVDYFISQLTSQSSNFTQSGILQLDFTQSGILQLLRSTSASRFTTVFFGSTLHLTSNYFDQLFAHASSGKCPFVVKMCPRSHFQTSLETTLQLSSSTHRQK